MDGITDSMDMSLSKLRERERERETERDRDREREREREREKDRGAWHAAVHVSKESDTTEQVNNNQMLAWDI